MASEVTAPTSLAEYRARANRTTVTPEDFRAFISHRWAGFEMRAFFDAAVVVAAARANACFYVPCNHTESLVGRIVPYVGVARGRTFYL